MTSYINKVILIGNVGKDPEIKNIQNFNSEVATFPVATSEKWKDKNSGKIQEKTEWHKIVIFAPGLIKITKQYIKKRK